MKKFLPYLLGLLLIVIDQLVKWWVLSHSSFVIKNPGFIFGYGPNLDLFFWVALFLILILFLFTIKKTKSVYSVTIMLAGASSNLLDRLTKGGVVDYLKIRIFPDLVFNLADIILISGVIIYVWQNWRDNKN